MPESDSFKVNLENYYGPMDLLLHLVKETEVDITRITLAQVCEQYVGFLSAMERLDINLSGNFLVLASQLLLIKSRTLAPADLTGGEEGIEEEEETGDASLELIKKLLDYKRFKDRARALGRMGEERARQCGRPRLRLEGEPDPEPLRNLELWDLVLLWSRVLKGTRLDATISILYRDIPLEVFVDRILRTLAEKPSATFAELVGEAGDRGRVIGTFLALLELAKERKIEIDQEGDRADIRVSLRAPEPAPVTPA